MPTERKTSPNPSSPFQRIARAIRPLLFETDPTPEPLILSSGDGVVVITRHSVLVIDCSGSMNNGDWPPSRLAAAKEAARTYVRQLALNEPNAQVGVIAFSGSAQTVIPLTPVTESPRIETAIETIDIGSSTDVVAGLREVRSLLPRNATVDQQVILLTDGQHVEHGDPRNEAARLRKHAVIECVGIGGQPSDVDEELLKAIASVDAQGQPRYRWIGDKAQLVAHYRQLAGRLSRT